MQKQDIARARTTQDLERKYKFGESFAEAFGLANEAKSAANQAQQAAEEAKSAAAGVDTKLTQEEIFNRLTNNGADQGIYLKDGKIYINGTYMGIGTISSVNGKVQIDLTQETEPVFNTGISTNGLTVRADEAGADKVIVAQAEKSEYYDGYVGALEMYSATGPKVFRLAEAFSAADASKPQGVLMRLQNVENTRQAVLAAITDTAGLYLYNASGAVVGWLVVSADGTGSMLQATKINEKTVSWKANGDGTYTLIGQ